MSYVFRKHYRVELDYRVTTSTPVYVGVCEMHLLYERRCQSAVADLRSGNTSWQHQSLSLRRNTCLCRFVLRYCALKFFTTHGADFDKLNCALVMFVMFLKLSSHLEVVTLSIRKFRAEYSR